jgi:thioredoxin 1
MGFYITKILKSSSAKFMIQSVTERNFSVKVLTSDTPVLVNFGAPWCGLCKASEPLLIQFQQQWGEKIQLFNVNADDNFKLANTYRLTNLPTLILFVDGKPIQRLEGFRGREDLRHSLDRITLVAEQLKVSPVSMSGARD